MWQVIFISNWSEMRKEKRTDAKSNNCYVKCEAWWPSCQRCQTWRVRDPVAPLCHYGQKLVPLLRYTRRAEDQSSWLLSYEREVPGGRIGGGGMEKRMRREDFRHLFCKLLEPPPWIARRLAVFTSNRLLCSSGTSRCAYAIFMPSCIKINVILCAKYISIQHINVY